MFITNLLENCQGFEWGFLSAEMLAADLLKAAMPKSGLFKERDRAVGKKVSATCTHQAIGDLVSMIRETLEVLFSL
jgi:hypothetical protein